MLLLVDNFDSFTYNLAQYFQRLQQEVLVIRVDALTVEKVKLLAPNHLVISPGPGNPREAMMSCRLIEAFAGQIPLLGVCLGHQCIGEVFGATVGQARQIMHGKTSWISHNQSGIFAGCRNPLRVTRYHSLSIQQNTLPPCLQVTASVVDEEEIMAIEHTHMPIYGVQFHPESVLSQSGLKLLANFIGREYDDFDDDR